MITNQTRSVKSILLLAGSFTFAFLLGEMVHEYGHYFGHLAYGNPGIRVHLDPFGGSHIIGVKNLPTQVLGMTSAAGPSANLILGLASFAFLWKKRSPILLPFLLWGPVAMIQEGVTLSLGLLTPGGDAEFISTLGIPPLFILIIGITSLLTGLGLVSILLPVAGIKPDVPFARKLIFVLVGMCSLMLVRFLHAFWVAPANIMENLVPLVFSLLLAVIVVGLNHPLMGMMEKYIYMESALVTWSESAVGLILGAGMFTFQIYGLS
jgi:hypothetical protein